MADFLSVLVTIVGILMPLGYLLQTYRIVKNKSSKNVSVKMYYVFEFGFLIWLLYGISINSFPLVVSNIASLICAASTIISYFIYKK